MKEYQRKFATFGLFFIFLISMGIGADITQNIGNKTTEKKNIENKNNEIVHSSSGEVINFRINQTEVPQGSLQNAELGDKLLYNLTTNNDTDSVIFLLNRTGNDFDQVELTENTSYTKINDLFYKSWEYEQTIDTSKELGIYNGTIILKDGLETTSYNYNLSLYYPTMGLMVNSTELYEDGVYYCFLGDTLDYSFKTIDTVTEVTFDMDMMNKQEYDFPEYTDSSPITQDKFNIWEHTQEITTNKATGGYNGTIIINDPVHGDRNFYYNLSIMNPQPRIIKATFEDETYDPGQEINLYESESFPTYHFSEINISCYVMNENGLENISHVELKYENGALNNFKRVNLTKKGNPTIIGGYEVQKYSLSNNLTFDMNDNSILTMANWTMNQNYKFSLNVHDKGDIEAEDKKQFGFKWDFSMMNRPPDITEFIVKTDNIDETSFPNTKSFNFTIYANYTDAETDAAFGNNLYNFSHVANPNEIINLTDGVGLLNENEANNYDPSFIESRGDELFHKLSFDSPNDAYGFNFTFGPNFDFEDNNLYKGWYLNLDLNTIDISGDSLDLSLYIYDYSIEDWVKVDDINSISSGEERRFIFNSLNSPTTIDSQNIKNYFKKERNNRIMMGKLSSEGADTSGEINIDKISTGFKFNRRVGPSDMRLEIYRPLGEDPVRIINMKNLYDLDWDNTGSRWACNYSYIPPEETSIYENKGAWSFILKAYDYGVTDFKTINPTEYGGESLLSNHSGYVRNDKKRSYAIDSVVKSVGLDRNQILSLKDVSMDIKNPDDEENATIFVELNDNDSTTNSSILKETYNLEFNEDLDNYPIYVQDGDMTNWITNREYLKPHLKIDDEDTRFVINSTLEPSLVLGKDGVSQEETKPSSMQSYGDGQIFRFSINNIPDYDDNEVQHDRGYINNSFGILFGFQLDWNYWLTVNDISNIQFSTRITVNSSEHLRTYDVSPDETSVQAWNWTGDKWFTPMESFGKEKSWKDDQTSGLIQPNILKMDNQTNVNEIWNSSKWNQTQEIKDCVDQSRGNLMYFRILENDLIGDLSFLQESNQRSFNLSIDYLALNVEYNNSYQANLTVFDSLSNNPISYGMKQHSNTATTRTWKLKLPTSLLSSRNYHFGIWAQNGNSSIRYDKGRIMGFKSRIESDFSWYPYYEEGKSINESFSFKSKPTSINYFGVQNPEKLIYHRQIDPFLFNGTIDYEDKLDNILDYQVQFRHWKDGANRDDWYSFKARNIDKNGTTIFEFNNQTEPQEWFVNITFTFAYQGFEWSSGVWYYRVIAKTNETTINSTIWREFRLLNYQPKEIELKQLESGSYHRVIDPLDYEISFVDLEGNNLENFEDWNAEEYYDIDIAFNIRNRDNNLKWERWDSNTISNYISKTPEEYRYGFDGNIRFARLIEVGTYSDIFITVKDFDEDWPQIGTLRITDRTFNILNNKPIVAAWLDSNATGEQNNIADNYDQVYRENEIELTFTALDYDDFGYDLNTSFFNLNAIDNNGNPVEIDENDSIFLSSDNPNDSGYGWFSTWTYKKYIKRNNETGVWNYTLNIHDRDGAELEQNVTFSLEILNNLPILDNLIFKRYDQYNALIEKAYLTSHFSNLTDFGIFRENETLKVTADIHDIEDTWLSEYNYQIQDVNFSLINNYVKKLGETYTNDNFQFSLVSAGTDQEGLNSVYENYLPSSFTEEDYDSGDNKILEVKDDDGSSASLESITDDDGNYQNITFINSIKQSYGGEYNAEISGLSPLFELHTKSMVFNLSFKFKTNIHNTDPERFDGFEVYIQNKTETVEEGQWIKLPGILNSTSWTVKNFTLNSAEIRDFLTEKSGNKLKFKILAKGFYPTLNQKVELDIDQVYLSYYKIENLHFERWEFENQFSVDLRPGDLTFRLKMTDNDQDTGIEESNRLNIYNTKPKMIDKGFWIQYNENNLTESEIDIDYAIANKPSFELFIKAKDLDSPDEKIKSIKITADINRVENLVSYENIIGGGLQDFEFMATEIETETDNLYRIIFSLKGTDTETEETNIRYLGVIKDFEIISISVSDKDFGYCNNNDPRFSSTLYNNTLVSPGSPKSYILHFRQETGGSGEVPIVLISILASVGGAALIFIFYRRYISYRKYLD